MRLALISRPGTRGNSCAAVTMHNFSITVRACEAVAYRSAASVIAILNMKCLRWRNLRARRMLAHAPLASRRNCGGFGKPLWSYWEAPPLRRCALNGLPLSPQRDVAAWLGSITVERVASDAHN